MKEQYYKHLGMAAGVFEQGDLRASGLSLRGTVLCASKMLLCTSPLKIFKGCGRGC